MPVNPSKPETRAQRVGKVAKEYEVLIAFITGLLLGYAFGWPV